jgi:hypothetical protein
MYVARKVTSAGRAVVPPLTLATYLSSLPGFATHRFSGSAPLARHTFDTCFAREAAFQAFFSAFHQQVEDLRPILAGGSAALRPSLKATMGAPGSGKSYFLDQLTNFMKPGWFASVASDCPEPSRTIFDHGNVLSINITFYGSMGFDHDMEAPGGMTRALVLRILYSYVLYIVSLGCIYANVHILYCYIPLFEHVSRHFPVLCTTLF